MCFVQLQSHERNKLEPRSRMCCFLGYGLGQKGYRCYDPISKRLRISRHVVFWEHIPFSKIASFDSLNHQQSLIFVDDPPTNSPNATIPSSISMVQPNSADIHDPTSTESLGPTSSFASGTSHSHHSPSHPTHEIRTLSGRVSKPNVLLKDYHCYFALAALHEPRNFSEASKNSLWQKAMNEELNALIKNNTWDLVDLPPEKSVVGCKWLYKIKTHADGSVERYKARLVAKGYTQEYGIDYEETFAPVARLTSVRALIAVASARKWSLYQMNVKNAFLNGDLTEEFICNRRQAIFMLLTKFGIYIKLCTD